MRLFKKRRFKEGRLVNIQLLDELDPHKIVLGILEFIRKERRFPIRGAGSTTGRGMYIAFHSVEDAIEIEKHIEKRFNEIKKLANTEL